MTRYVIDIAYKGTAYNGWQVQENALSTVQAEVNKALSTVLRTSIETYGAGRTDAGVHALQLPAHFDYYGDLHPSFVLAVNSILPHDIAVHVTYKALDPDFHARHKGISRAYKYRMVFRKDPIRLGLAWWCRAKVDFAKMEEGAAILMEYNSFKCFTKRRGTQQHYICNLAHSYFEWEGDEYVYNIKANRFLRGMVRAIVGTLTMMGSGKINADDLRRILESDDRKMAGPNVPPDGLYLTEVLYRKGALEKIEFMK